MVMIWVCWLHQNKYKIGKIIFNDTYIIFAYDKILWTFIIIGIVGGGDIYLIYSNETDLKITQTHEYDNNYWNIMYFYERNCSIQIQYQKNTEKASFPNGNICDEIVHAAIYVAKKLYVLLVIQ